MSPGGQPPGKIAQRSTELHGRRATMILDMPELELLKPRDQWVSLNYRKLSEIRQEYVLLAFCVEVYPSYRSFHLIKANVVEAFKTRPRNRSYTMIRDEEVLFPPHEYVLTLGIVPQCEILPFALLHMRSPRRKPGPMLHIRFFCRTPCFISGYEGMLRSDNFPLKKRC